MSVIGISQQQIGQTEWLSRRCAGDGILPLKRILIILGVIALSVVLLFAISLLTLGVDVHWVGWKWFGAFDLIWVKWGFFANQEEGHYNSGMIDLDAPLVPGKSAAGVAVGSPARELLATVVAQSTTKVSSGEKHDLGTVKVWTKDGVIIQVGVYSGHRGVLEPGIQVGSTISDVEQSFGCSVEQDEQDNLVVPTSPGWCFETGEWKVHRL
jgi:hypothetical protein